MSPSTKCIGLLLIGGLMLVFYPKSLSGPDKTETAPHQSKSQPIKQCHNSEHHFSFFKEVIANILPELKKLD
jgi:hypothetical protein